eukprot:scaffold576_cov260-Pinguiococcus_pyrenoidosus.AAC.43
MHREAEDGGVVVLEEALRRLPVNERQADPEGRRMVHGVAMFVKLHVAAAVLSPIAVDPFQLQVGALRRRGHLFTGTEGDELGTLSCLREERLLQLCAPRIQTAVVDPLLHLEDSLEALVEALHPHVLPLHVHHIVALVVRLEERVRGLPDGADPRLHRHELVAPAPREAGTEDVIFRVSTLRGNCPGVKLGEILHRFRHLLKGLDAGLLFVMESPLEDAAVVPAGAYQVPQLRASPPML